MGHTYCDLLIHAVFSTKDRRPLIREHFADRLHEYLGGVAREEFGRALAVGGASNHVHGLILLRPDVCVSDAMCKWKSLSSGWIHKTFPDACDFAWQAGYAAFSVSSSNRDRVATYIAGQADHHRKRTFEKELLAILERHSVRYDPAHVWD